MKRETTVLVSGDRSEQSPEVVCVKPGASLPDLELAPVIVPKETIGTRVSPHPWEKNPQKWYANYDGAQWVWTTRHFEPREGRGFGEERLTIRRYFDLPDAAPGSIKVRLIACCVGGMVVRLNGKTVGTPDWGKQGADNYYVDLDEDVTHKALAARNLLQFDVKRYFSPASGEGTLPAGLIYKLDISWERETKTGMVAKAITGALRVLASATFRVLGLLGFLVFLFLALYPDFDTTTRIVFATVATGFIGAWNLPGMWRDLKERRMKGD